MTTKNKIVGDLPNISTADANGNIIDISLTGNVTAGESIVGNSMMVTGDAVITGNANVQGTLTYNNVTTITTSNLVLGLGNSQTGINVTGGGMVVGNTNEASFLYNQPANSWDSNINITSAGNITADYFIGNAAFLTGLPATYGNTDVFNYLGSNSNVVITTTGNISASKFIGDGNLLTNVIAKTSIVNGNSIAQVYANGNITMSVSNVANVATVTTDSLRVNGNIYDINGQVYGVPANNYYAGFSSAPANVVTGGTIKFNGQYSSYGSGITYDSSTGIFTLRPGTYELSASLALSNLTGNGELDYVWMNITAGNTYIGSQGGVLTPNSGAVAAGWQSLAEAIITVVATTQVKLYVVFAGNGGTGQQLSFNQSHAIINQIGGGAPITNIASYAKYTRGAQQTTGIVAGGRIICDVPENFAGGDIYANLATGQITLLPGKTYRLTGMVPGFTISTVGDTRLAVCWYDETAGGWIGNSAEVYNPVSSAQNGAFGGAAEAVITPTTTTVVSFRILSVTGSVGGLGGNSDFSTAGSYPWVDIEVIGGLTPTTNPTQMTSYWTVPTGTSNVSLTLPLNGTYTVWVLGNIPNGIVTYNATLTVTNPNVPLIGTQYGWYYTGGGNLLVLNSLPQNVVGTNGAIITATGSVSATNNVLTFSITNNSGASQVVRWGYTRM